MIMGRSFIEFRERGFWCSDGPFEVWAYYMHEMLANAVEPQLRAYREHLWVQATVGMPGCKDLGVGEMADTARQELARVAERLPRHLASRPELLTAEHLNPLGLGGPGV